MSELLRLLVLYYACDIAATERHLPPAEWMHCTGHYIQVKRHFADNATGPQAHQLGYRRFKTWEAENPALVAELRARSQH